MVLWNFHRMVISANVSSAQFIHLEEKLPPRLDFHVPSSQKLVRADQNTHTSAHRMSALAAAVQRSSPRRSR